jgi:F0F1-type ATP synthase membrane subunit a
MSVRLFGNILGGGVIYLILREFVGSFKHYFLGYIAFVLFFALVFLSFKKCIFGQKMQKLLNVLISAMFLITWVHVFFGIFEGLIQSFVITMLTTTYLAIGTHMEDETTERHGRHKKAEGAPC